MIAQPHPIGLRLLPWRISPWLIDLLLVSVAVLGFVRRPFSQDGAFEIVDWVALGVGVAVLLVRRRYPLSALVVAVTTSLALVAIADRPSMLLPVALVALFTVGLDYERPTAIVAGTITTVLFGLMIIALLSRGEIDGAGLASIAWPAFAVTAGAVVRSSRENMASAQERAERAEQSRELEAQRRVVEERLRIARDVHDLVAHHIAVVNVQAGVAGHLMETDPPAAGKALDVVREAASTVVDQLGELLSVLRSPDEVEDPTSPTPNLDGIDDLISTFAASGLHVERQTSGARRPLSGSAELAAYRVVQEALTNAHKHGDGSATVSQSFDDHGLTISVTNATSAAASASASTTAGPGGTGSDTGSSASTGFGIMGMRERVEAVGGTLVTSTPGQQDPFTVTATIPRKADI